MEKTGRTARQDWKYNKDIKQHYVEVDESGELTKTYKQSDEYTERGTSDKPLKKKKLSTSCPHVDVGDDSGDEEPADVEVEQQDSLYGLDSVFWKP